MAAKTNTQQKKHNLSNIVIGKQLVLLLFAKKTHTHTMSHLYLIRFPVDDCRNVYRVGVLSDFAAALFNKQQEFSMLLRLCISENENVVISAVRDALQQKFDAYGADCYEGNPAEMVLTITKLCEAERFI